MICEKVFESKHVNHVCSACHAYLAYNLGGDYYMQDWYKEAVNNWRAITASDKRYTDMIAFYISPYREIYRELEESSITNVIKRLVNTYGYGSRTVMKILQSAYKTSLPERTVERLVSEYKKVKPQGNEAVEQFWRDWHRELHRLEKEQNIE